MTPPGAILLAVGGSGAVFTYPDRPDVVSKRPYNTAPLLKNFEIKKRVYRRLGRHPNIIGCLHIDKDGIDLERAQHGCIRQFYREGNRTSLQERIR
jgi:hypothetical protein